MTDTEFDKNITDNLAALRDWLTVLDDQREAANDLGVATAAETIAKLADGIMRDAIRNERAIGRTWQQIGDHFGTTRQGAHERFSRPSDLVEESEASARNV